MIWRMRIQPNRDVILMMLLRREMQCFFPDSIEEAHRQGYENCKRGIGKRTSKLGVRLKIEE